MKPASRHTQESGIALITTMLLMLLISALMVGFFAAISADQKENGIDRDQTQAYAAAHAGLEKLTTDLASLFLADISPSGSAVNAMATHPPTIPGFSYIAPNGTNGSGYSVTFTADANGNPAPDDVNGTNITTGPYQGFKGIITRYPITITARSQGGAEVRLRREVQTIAVPVFQFGVFSDSDLTFYGGDNFGFGGRVHTNGNLFLAESAGFTLTFADKITAVKEVFRGNLANGVPIANVAFTGTVNVPTAIGPPAVYRALASTESSVTSLPGVVPSTPNTNWTSISTGTYKSIIRTKTTGARQLDLTPLTAAAGAAPIDLIRRPTAAEAATSLIFKQRMFKKASLRILLSDTAADITALPTVTGTAPIQLDGNWNTTPPAGYGPVDATHAPLALSPGTGALASTTVSGGASTTTTVNVVAVPSYYLLPATLTVTKGSNSRTVSCKGRTKNTFTGCVAIGTNLLFSTPATVTANVTDPLMGTTTFSAVTSVDWTSTTAVAGNTITVGTVAQNRTAPFADSFMFVDGRPVTCQGYDTATAPPQFNNCSGLNVAPPANAKVNNGYLTPLATNSIGGFIKIEKQGPEDAWTDVTAEILNLGITAGSQLAGAGAVCTDAAAAPNAILRIQRLRDNGIACNYAGSTNPADYWPNVLFDAREGNVRDQNATTDMSVEFAGVMHYISLDVNNLKRWLAGTIGTTGTTALNDNGYIVYFSDRRNNRNAANLETAEYGYEDVINPATAAGTPNGGPTPDAGEDVNGNGTLDVYGGVPRYNASTVLPVTWAAPLVAASTPWTLMDAGQARVNRAIFFRRALKLVNAGTNLPTAGLTVASENPVYVHGNYNAISTSVTGASVPASVIGDAVTLLSNNWKDSESFTAPNDPGGASTPGRPGLETGYRFAVIAGKGLSFPNPAWATSVTGFIGPLFGTDGGVGNFLRLLEDWTGQTIHYKGSIISLFSNRQALGTFKCCQNVYVWTLRDYTFDTNFLTPSLLPPGTPRFSDVNTLTFRQLLRPTE